MSIDLSQFHGVFFEESFEGLEVMEVLLLELDVDNPDKEQINSIFRAAHSIKGGSGTFGFLQVADFTHVLETLLDKVRDGEESIDADGVELFLQSVDCLRGLLEALQAEKEPDMHRANQLAGVFQAVLDGGTYAQSSSLVKVNAITGELLVSQSTEVVDDNINVFVDQTLSSSLQGIGFKIFFKPELGVLKRGNDPIRMLRELATLGQIKTTIHDSKLPPLETLVVDNCYLSWTIELLTACEIGDVEEIFEWIEDECELSITPLLEDSAAIVSGHYQDPKRDSKIKDTANLEQQLVGLSDKSSGLSDAQATSYIEPSAPRVLDEVTSAPVKQKPSKIEASSIRVSVDKVDSLINLVGELVITQSMLGRLGASGEGTTEAHIGNLREGLVQLEQNARELQDSVMRIRMLPISFTFNRLPRMVRDISIQLGKQVQLELSGEHTELDKTVMEKISDPMVHLIRNALDHGIEMPAQRRASGKPELGTIVLNAFHQGGNIVIEMIDDGAGIDTERLLDKARKNGF